MPMIPGSKPSKHWFHSKTPAQKKAYIAAHPNSVYAKTRKKPLTLTQMTPEQRAQIKERKARTDGERKDAWAATQDKRYSPKAHAERMKQHDSSIKLYSGKAESLAKKVDAAHAKVAQHTASGSRHLAAAKTKLKSLTNRHKNMTKLVKDLHKHRKASESAYKKHHAKKSK